MEAKDFTGMMNRRPGSAAPSMNARPQKTLGVPGSAPATSAPKDLQNVAGKVPAAPGMKAADSTVRNVSASDGPADIVRTIKDMTGSFAVLSDTVLQQNMDMMLNPEIPVEDRTISLVQLHYLASHVAPILMGLVFNDKFRQAFVDALNMEIKLDDETPESRAKIRAGFNLGNNYSKRGSITLGVTELTPSAHEAMNDCVKESFALMDPFQKEFDEAAAKLAMEKRVELGFIFSNFMYLVRAFSYNEVFFSYVTNVVERVQASVAPAKK